MMNSVFHAISFIINSSYRGHNTISVEIPVKLAVGGGFINAIVYFPRDRDTKEKCLGTILAVHGMTPRGNTDPRMIAVCRAFARCGFYVVAPHYPDIASFKICYETVDSIAATIRFVARDRVLCPEGKISIFSASFSAGMSIIASSTLSTADMVRSICSVGTYGFADAVIDHMISDQESDEYGRLIVLHNFIRHAPGFDDDVIHALEEAILDDGLKRKTRRFEQILDKMDSSTRYKITKLLTDPAFRMHHWRKFISTAEDVCALMEKLSVVRHIDGLKASVAFIHGAKDKVIPPSESKALHKLMRSNGLSSRLVITSLISHGDTRLSLSKCLELLNLIKVIAFFIKYAKSKALKQPAVNKQVMKASAHVCN